MLDPVPYRSDAPPRQSGEAPTVCFHVQARAEASVLPRALDLFAKRAVIPSKWHSVLTGRGHDELHIDIQVAGLSREMTDRIAACLRQMVHVDLVLTTEKHTAEAGQALR